MIETALIFIIAFFAGSMATYGLGTTWLKAKPERLKMALKAIVDGMAEFYEGDNFEVYGTLVLGEKQALAVKIYVKPSDMSDAIATYALKDVDISRVRSKKYEHPTSQEDPSCKAKKV